jgi:hypothetical protein
MASTGLLSATCFPEILGPDLGLAQTNAAKSG